MYLCILTTITWVTVARGPLPPISVLSRTPLVQKVKRVLGDTLHITNNAAVLGGIGESPPISPPLFPNPPFGEGGGGGGERYRHPRQGRENRQIGIPNPKHTYHTKVHTSAASFPNKTKRR